MKSAPKKNQINTIADYHKLVGLPAPISSLLSVINFEDVKWKPNDQAISIVHNFIALFLKNIITGNASMVRRKK